MRGSNRHLAAAVKKYGAHNFSREVLATCHSQEQTDTLERLWICTLRTYDPHHGYNMQFGGKWRAARHTPETRRRIARCWTVKEKERLREAAQLLWQRRTMAERQEIGQKISLAKQGKASRKKGCRYGPQTKPCPRRRELSEMTRQRISEGLRKYWATRTEASVLHSRKKPVALDRGREEQYGAA